MSNPQYEIGGYLELERYHGESLHPGSIELDCGRNCLLYVARLREASAVWLPDLLRHTLRDTLEHDGIRTLIYRVNERMLPDYDFEVGDGELLCLVDYYGQLSIDDVNLGIEFANGRLVVDETHGLFRAPWDGADTFWSVRKWLGVPDGAYLYTRDGSRLSVVIPRAESRGRMAHILGRTERPSSEFLFDHRVCDASFAEERISGMSVIAESLIGAINRDFIIRRRRANWDVLSEAFAGINRMTPVMPKVPFMYPLLVDDATGVREQLNDAGVFVPLFWPDVLSNSSAGKQARDFAMNLLPLPIDQRYELDDMEYVARTVTRALGSRGGE